MSPPFGQLETSKRRERSPTLGRRRAPIAADGKERKHHQPSITAAVRESPTASLPANTSKLRRSQQGVKAAPEPLRRRNRPSRARSADPPSSMNNRRRRRRANVEDQAMAPRLDRVFNGRVTDDDQ